MVTDRSVFVVGMARSGTTLIGAMIGAHPELTVAPETHFLDLCVQAKGFEAFILPKDRKAIWRAYAKEERFRVLGLDADAIEERIEAEDVRNFAAMYRVLLEAYAEKLGRRGWGDKTHLDHGFLEWLLDAYPETRIVCVIRDPRATVASLLRAPWSSGQAFYYALQWRETMTIVRNLEDNGRVLIVQYEDAVLNTDESLARMCSFIGVAASDEMLNRSDDPSPVAPDSEWTLGEWWRQHKEKALGPVSAESIDRWQQELSAYEIAVIEHLCRDAMQCWGYRTATDGLRPSQGVRLLLQRAVRVVRGALRPRRAFQGRKSIFSPRV